jgi:hypothetical protein
MPSNKEKPIPPTPDSIEMLREVRTRLFDAFREDCPARELAQLARRIQEVSSEVAEYDNDSDSWRKHLDILRIMQVMIKQAIDDPKCPHRELSPLTRRLQSIVKDVGSVTQKVQLVEGKNSGRSGSDATDDDLDL